MTRVTPVKRPKPRRPRKPETIIRKARDAINRAHRTNWFSLGDDPIGDTNQQLLRALRFLSELRRSLSQGSPKG